MSARSLFSALVIGALLAPAALAEPFRVGIDQTVTLKLATPANSIVVGNATVADVTVHDANTLLITGKAFGATNLLVLDRAGNTVYSTQLTVAGEADGELTIVRAGGTYSYSCIEKCRGTATVGDVPDHFAQVMTTVTGKQATATGGGQ